MILARSLVASDGTVLLQAGVTLRTRLIPRLKELGYTSLYIREKGLEDVEIPQPVSELTRQEATRSIRQAFQDMKKTHALDYSAISEAVRNIVEEVLQNNQVLIHLGDIRSHDDYTFAHSVNVGILCALIGRGLGYTPKQIHDLAVGGLLHDVGKIFIPAEILNKPGELTEEEMRLVREHPRIGFDILRRCHRISLLAAHMAYQHHELLDGSGYPRQLRGEEIHVYGRINAVADAFDALTVDRPYRKAKGPMEAVAILHQRRGIHYDPKAVAVLRSYVAPYPVTSRVRLNTGEVAVVVRVYKDALERPVVRIVHRHGKPLEPPYPEVDLRVHEHLSIVGLEEE